jgi:DNA polymerase III subunit delta
LRVYPERLSEQLARGLAPMYLVFGEEPLLIAEAADAVRSSARERGYTERVVFAADTTFDWGMLSAEAFNASLFSAHRLLELRLQSLPNEAGSQLLVRYAGDPPADCLLLVTAGKLDGQVQRSRWVQSVDRAGVVVPIRPPRATELPTWIRRRLQDRGVRPTPEAVSLLAERVEGNLLAASQEIEKLCLLHHQGDLDTAALLGSVGDSARFSVYDLADAALERNVSRGVRVLERLRAEGVEPPLVLWALVREIRMLLQIAHDRRSGQPVEQSLVRRQVWEQRRPRMRAALNGRADGDFCRLLHQAAHCDRVIKGAESGDPWGELLALTTGLAGCELPSGAAAR